VSEHAEGSPVRVARELPALEATEAMAHTLAAMLRPGDTMLLRGDLGAGKTTLVRMLSVALGADERDIASPTFVLAHDYQTRGSVGEALPRHPIARIIHVDAYRVTSSDDLEAAGWDQMFDAQTREPKGTQAGGAIAIVEWPDRLPPGALASAERVLGVTLEATGASARRLTLDVPASWSDRAEVRRVRELPPTRCRSTGRWVAPTSPTYPFIDERARLADLHGWLTEGYRTSRTPRDDEDAAT
jgi:tRNA threonylcarbamoyladenosine biosynthesis protein TsaE